ncbi:hypothetical protein FLX56_27830 [Synechococcus moorigangaii CMS01]|nr:hypothetical protein [Synechococcus moorigangaii CMS01]
MNPQNMTHNHPAVLKDNDTLMALDELGKMLNQAITKAENLLAEAWDRDEIQQVMAEIAAARQTLKSANEALHDHQERGQNCLQELSSGTAKAQAIFQELKEIINQAEKIHSQLESQKETGDRYLKSLSILIRKQREYKADFDQINQTLEAAENLISVLNHKYESLLDVEAHILELLKSLDGYQSIQDLILSIQRATEKLQVEQTMAQDAIEQMVHLQEQLDHLIQTQSLNDREYQMQIEGLNEQVRYLIQAQSAPWWWPSNWWWKRRATFTPKHF